MPGELINERCPECGCPLLIENEKKWCSLAGCTYGLKELGPRLRKIVEDRERLIYGNHS